MGIKNWIWDKEQQTIRGSFINITITILYLMFIGMGMAWNRVAENLKEMETFLIGFYLVSFGVWATKKTVEFVKFTNAENIVNSVLGKVGIGMGSIAQNGDRIKVKDTDKDKQ